MLSWFAHNTTVETRLLKRYAEAARGFLRATESDFEIRRRMK